MKKLLALLLIIALSSAVFPAYANETTFNENREAISFVKAFDLMPVYDYENFESNAEVHRGEFARILCQVYGIGTSSGENSQFVDVDSNEWAGYIYAAVEYGLMNGAGKYMFEPERAITVTEAVKVFVDMLGYKSKAELNGGYPSGYLFMASQLKILAGIEKNEHTATAEDIAKLIHNCLDVPVLKQTSFGESISYSSYDNKTMMTEILKIDRIEGVVTDNGLSSLYGNTQISVGRVIINNTIFNVKEGYDVTGFFGHSVVAYYKLPDNTSDETILFMEIDKNETEERTVFDLDDFNGFSGNEISYYVGDKIKTIRLGNTPDIILNGKLEKSFDASFFEFDNGTVCYIPSLNGQEEKLIIEGWVSWYLAGVDKNEGIIYGSPESRSINGSHSLKINVGEIGKSVIIYDEYGRYTDFKDIYVYTILDICANGDIIKIKIPHISAIDGTLDSRYSKDDKNFVNIGGTEYRATKHLENSDKFKKLSIGERYRIFLDSFGKIAYVEMSSGSATMELGLMIASAVNKDFGSDNVIIKVMTNEALITTFETAEKLNFSDQYGDEYLLKGIAVAEKIKDYSGVFGYRVNAENKIKELHLPVLPGYNREKGRLGLCYESVNQYYYYESGQTRLQGDVVFNANVPAFAFYESESSDENRYRYSPFRSLPRASSESSTVRGYNYDPDSRYAECLYYASSSEMSEKVSVNGGRYIMILNHYETIDSNGEKIVGIQGYDFPLASFKEFTMEKKLFDAALSTTDGKAYQMKKGDIIIGSLIGSKISLAQILYRSDMDNVTDPSGSRGNILGTIGYFDAAYKKMSLPYIPNADVDVRTGSVFTNVGRTTVASVYSVDSFGGVIFTTLDLSCKSYENDYDETKHVTEVVLPPASNAFSVVTYNKKNINVRTGTLADIKAYKNVGSDCSKLLLIQEYGNVKYFIIFNNDMDSTN